MEKKQNICIPLSDQRSFSASYEVGNSGNLVIILPGLNYSCDKPLLVGVIEMLRARQVSVVALDFTYSSDDQFLDLPEAEQLAIIRSDGNNIVKSCLGRGNFQSLIVVGKSLGTVSIGGLSRNELPGNTRLVWLTPSLTGTGLFSDMKNLDVPGFSLIGERDPSIEITRNPEYRQLRDLAHLEVAGMDHGWQHENGPVATKSGLDQAMAAFSKWL